MIGQGTLDGQIARTEAYIAKTNREYALDPPIGVGRGVYLSRSNARSPVYTPADLKGLRVAYLKGSFWATHLISKNDAIPVPMTGMDDITAAMQSGDIQGALVNSLTVQVFMQTNQANPQNYWINPGMDEFSIHVTLAERHRELAPRLTKELRELHRTGFVTDTFRKWGASFHKQSKRLKVAVFDGCPFICPDGSGTVISLLRWALEGSGYQMDFIHMNFERSKRQLASGGIDLLPAVIVDSVTPALYPDTPLFATQMCFVVQKSDSWNYSGIPSLAGRRLMVEKGIIHTPEFYAHIQADPQVHKVPGINVPKRLLQLLSHDRGDTITIERTVFQEIMKEERSPTEPELRLAGCFKSEPEYLGVNAHRSDSRTLTALLTRKLQEFGGHPVSD